MELNEPIFPKYLKFKTIKNMHIITKYGLEDNLFFIEHNKVVTKKIISIEIKISKDYSKISYGYKSMHDTVMDSNPMCYIEESLAFFTKEELLKSL